MVEVRKSQEFHNTSNSNFILHRTQTGISAVQFDESYYLQSPVSAILHTHILYQPCKYNVEQVVPPGLV
jgi:hypothetical protein